MWRMQMKNVDRAIKKSKKKCKPTWIKFIKGSELKKINVKLFNSNQEDENHFIIWMAFSYFQKTVSI